MTDIAEIKIAIDKANREMYEAVQSRDYETARQRAFDIRELGHQAVCRIVDDFVALNRGPMEW